MDSREFAKIVWKQWAMSPKGKIQPEEIRPMKDYQNTGLKTSRGDKTVYSKFTAWAVSYPDDNDPWVKDYYGLDGAWGIWMELDDAHLFQLKEMMIDIDDTKVIKEIGEDGKERRVQVMGYRSALPFVSTFNKSVYDVIFREHIRLQDELGKSPYTKALTRFDAWFKENGFVEDHGHGIELFWSKNYNNEQVSINPPAENPEPLSDEDKWKDVLIELARNKKLKSGGIHIRIKHPKLPKAGKELSFGSLAPKQKEMLFYMAKNPSYYLDLLKISENVQSTNGVQKNDIYNFNIRLKSLVGINSENLLQPAKKKVHPVISSIRLDRDFVLRYMKIDIRYDLEADDEKCMSTEELDEKYKAVNYAVQWNKIKPSWYKQD